MLTKIGLENFKSWRQLDIDLAPITILFGTNSSGKTSVLQALLLLKQTVNSFDRKQHINFGGGDRDYVDFGSYQDLVFGHDVNKNLRINLNWLGVSRNIQTEYDIIWQNSQNKTLIKHLSYLGIIAPQENFPKSVKLSQIENTNKYNVNLSEKYQDQFEPIEIEAGYQLPLLSVEELNETDTERIYSQYFVTLYSHFFEWLINRIQYLGPLRGYPERYYQWTGSVPGVIEPDGQNTIQTLIASEKQSNNILRQVANWIVELGLVDDLKLATPNDRFYEPKIVIDEMESALVDVGFGVSQVLPVITMLLSAEEGSIILLEQPELHLHPNAQMVLADLMLYVAEERNLQLIVESHSEHLLRRLQRRIAEVEHDFANPDNIKMYFCESSKAGSTVREVEVDEYGQIADWPPNFFGDISGDLDAMTKAALNRRRQELSGD